DQPFFYKHKLYAVRKYIRAAFTYYQLTVMQNYFVDKFWSYQIWQFLRYETVWHHFISILKLK
ncbi:hypothetical protein ACWA34_27355, partial [Escherichia coli]